MKTIHREKTLFMASAVVQWKQQCALYWHKKQKNINNFESSSVFFEC